MRLRASDEVASNDCVQLGCYHGRALCSAAERLHAPPRPPGTAPRLAFVLLAALCLVAPADAQPTAALAGVVADATGGPLTDAAITVRGSVERTARTGADGRFAIEKLTAGDYDLTADAIGFAPVTPESPACSPVRPPKSGWSWK